MNKPKQVLTPEQWEKYAPLLQEMEKIRNLSEEEKEQMLLQIISTTYIDLLCDWAFKHVFGHNKENLMMLLNDFLPEKIVDLEYDSNEIDLFAHDDKLVVMDVVCITEEGRRILVEMQKSEKKNFRNRMLYYGAGMLYKQLHSRDNYDKLMPVYVICFMNFTLRHETDQLVYHYEMLERSSHERYEPTRSKEQLLSVYYCELPRFAGPGNHKMSPIEEWFDILKNMNTFVSKPAHVNQRFNGILEACRQTQLPDVEQMQYVRAMISDREKQDIEEAALERGFEQGVEQGIKQGLEQGIKQGLEQGVKQGLEQGIEQEKVLTVKRLLAVKAEMQTIVAATGLTEEQIKEML